MSSGRSILKTKLTPLQTRRPLLRRPSLSKLLKEVLTYPLTLVQASPGYGKSSALASFLCSESYDYGWYSAGTNESKLETFAAYLIHAVRTFQPGFGEQLLELLSQDDQDPYAMCEAFINELVVIDKDFVLVIDDYHQVGGCLEIDQFMQYLLQYMPVHAHLLISTRKRPAWELLTTMKVKGDLLEIGERELAFSEEEIEVLFNDIFEYPTDADAAKKMYEESEGWAVSLQLIWQRLHYQNTSHANELSSYYSSLLNQETSEIREFLMQASVLHELSDPICDKLFVNPAVNSLEELSGQGLYLSQKGDGRYQFHLLFRNFLNEQLNKNAEQFQAAHERAAGLLCEYGKELLQQGKLQPLYDAVKNVPLDMKDRFCALWILEGDVHRYWSSYEKAISCYGRGESKAEEAGDWVTQCMGLEGQARIYLDTIQPGKAEMLLAQAIQLMEQQSAYGKQADLIRLYSLMAENLINLGSASFAENWYEKCRSLQPDFREDLLEARLHLRTGRLAQSKKIISRAKKSDADYGTPHLPRAHRETDIMLSLIEAMLGNIGEAKSLAQSGMMQGIKQKAPFVEACGWMRMGHAAQLMSKYDFSVALNCYKTSLEIMEGINVSRGKAEPLMGLCLLYAREGAHEIALDYGKQALEETEKVKDEWLSTLIRLCMGIATYYSNRVEEAEAIFLDCKNRFTRCGDSYGVTVASLWLSLFTYMHEDHEGFQEHMEHFLKLAQTGSYDFLIDQRTLFGPIHVQQLLPLLIEAQKREIQPHYVNFLLSKLGMEHMTYHPGYTLRIETLGGFKVWIGEKEIGEKDWQRGKAKELFQLLVNRRQHLVTKYEIVSVLFGDLDEKSANRDLKVALNALNTALEPQRRARSTPFFIQRHGTSYGLNLASGLELDVIEFENWIRAGLEELDSRESLSKLEKGLALYKGDYMPDRRYEDWSIEERERLQVLFLRGSERLALLYLQNEQHHLAIHWCERILEHDPCWEEAYRLLMECHYKLNNRNQSIKWYQKCCKVLERELGVSPMQSTKQYYEAMLQTDVTHL